MHIVLALLAAAIVVHVFSGVLTRFRVMSFLLPALALAFTASKATAVEQVGFPSADGKLELTGYWFGVGDGEQRPAVIALHGCNGALDAKGQLSAKWRTYAGYFNAERMHFLVLDSFTPRKHGSICEIPNNRRTIKEEDRRDDVFAAIRWLAGRPGVDSSRIVVAGWSHGAQAVLSVLDITDKAVSTQPLQPRAAVAFYPGCAKFQNMFNYELSAPLLLMIGQLDDWTPASACEGLGRRLNKPGTPAFEMTVYPGSYHGFDGFGQVRVMQNLGNTRIGQATVGGNPEARKQSHARMFDFLAARLSIPMAMSHEERMRVRAAKALAVEP